MGCSCSSTRCGNPIAAMRDALRLMATVRRLRWRQWLYRPLRQAQGRFAAAPRERPARPEPAHAAALAELWDAAYADHAGVLERAEAALAGRFALVGEERSLPRPDWCAALVSPLW